VLEPRLRDAESAVLRRRNVHEQHVRGRHVHERLRRRHGAVLLGRVRVRLERVPHGYGVRLPEHDVFNELRRCGADLLRTALPTRALLRCGDVRVVRRDGIAVQLEHGVLHELLHRHVSAPGRGQLHPGGLTDATR
jgi:hypothetical protein